MCCHSRHRTHFPGKRPIAISPYKYILDSVLCILYALCTATAAKRAGKESLRYGQVA